MFIPMYAFQILSQSHNQLFFLTFLISTDSRICLSIIYTQCKMVLRSLATWLSASLIKKSTWWIRI